jgi:hypothetical protein
MSVSGSGGDETKELGPSSSSGIDFGFSFDLADGGDEGHGAVADGTGGFDGEDGEEFGFELRFGVGVE